MSDYDMCEVVDEPADVYTSRDRTARKQWVCDECDGAIIPGERYEHISMLYRGWGWSTYRVCDACLTGPVAFVERNCPGGRTISGLEEHLRYVFDEYHFQQPGVKFRVGRMLVEMRHRRDARKAVTS